MPAHWSIETVTPPAVEPVTLAEAKVHLRVNDGYPDDDAYIQTIITAARQWCEDYTGRAFITQTLKYWLDTFAFTQGWPPTIYVPRPPLQTVSGFYYYDPSGTLVTLASGTDYVLDNSGPIARVVPAYNKPWPIPKIHIKQVYMQFVAGYGLADSVPAKIKQAILLLVGDLFQYREQTVLAPNATVLKTLRYLLDGERVFNEFSAP